MRQGISETFPTNLEHSFLDGIHVAAKGLLAIAKLKPLSLFISLSLIHRKAFDNVEIEKLKVKVVLA